MKKSQVARLLAYVTGMVNQQLLLESEYLIAENRILRSHLPARVRLTDPQRATLAAIGKRLGRQALEHVAMVAKPGTILGWYRKLIAQKFNGSKHRAYPGRPTVGQEITELIVRMAHENSGWGYDRIAGSAEEPRTRCFRSNGGECPTPFWYRSCSEAPSANELGTLHSRSHDGFGRDRFFHRRSAHLARIGNLLRTLLLAPGDTSRDARRYH